MSSIKADELKDRLVTDFGFPPQGAALITEKILNLQPELIQSFEKWWKTGQIPELEIEGYSLEKLISDHSMKTIAAFLTLDWLVREPGKAKASLKRGHDTVSNQ